jgi:probable HAF family extracellular repeat protein
MMRRIVLVGCVLSLMWVGVGVAGATTYTITDLGTFIGSGNSSAYGINDSGQITGAADTVVLGHTVQHAFLRSASGTMTDLGSLGVETSELTYPDFGRGVNASGQVTGYGYYAFLGTSNHAFCYSGGTMTDVGNVVGVSDCYGMAIADNGTIAGYKNSGSPRAFIYSSGTTLTDLDLLPGGTAKNVAYAINSAGTKVAGSVYTAGNKANAAIWNGTTLATVIAPIYAGGNSVAFGINSNGDVTGLTNTTSSVTAPFIYSGGTMTALPGLGGTGGRGLAINDIGQVVGYASISGSATNRAFVYSGGVMTNLSDPAVVTNFTGWDRLDQAWDINSSGCIVGYGTTTGGLQRGFLLTPVPEPATLLLATAGLVSLLAYAWRKRR